MSKILKRISEQLDAMQDELANEISKMEEIYESRSEKWQESEKGQEMQTKIDTLQEAHENLDNCGGALLEVLGEI